MFLKKKRNYYETIYNGPIGRKEISRIALETCKAGL